jgi:CheY-like chemotaxis protein
MVVRIVASRERIAVVSSAGRRSDRDPGDGKARAEHAAEHSFVAGGLLLSSDMARGGFYSVDSLKNIHVLVVDKDPVARDMITSVLQYCGALVTAVASAAAALGMMRLIKPDAIVTELMLPDEDGYELIRQVRALKPEEGGTIPAIAVSRHLSADDRVRVLGRGFEVYLQKPLDPWEMCRVVSRLTMPG